MTNIRFVHRIRTVLSYVLLLGMLVYAVISFFWSNITDWIPFQGALAAAGPEVMFEILGIRTYIVSKLQILDIYDDLIVDFIAEYNRLTGIPMERRGTHNLQLERKLRYWSTQFTREYNGSPREPMPPELANIESARRDAERDALANHAQEMRSGVASPVSLMLDSFVDNDSSSEDLDKPQIRRRPSQVDLVSQATVVSTQDGLEV